MKNIKKENGISLILLSITVAIIILISITIINMVAGPDGFLLQTEKIAENKQTETNQKQEELDGMLDQLGKVKEEYQEIAKNNYTILYKDGTLTFSNANTKLEEKEIEREYGNIKNANFEVDNQVPWYSEREKIKTVDFLDVISPNTTTRWFRNCSNLTQIQNIQNLNTNQVTTMDEMFEGCTNLESLNLAGFETSNVTNMSGLFKSCTKLTTLNLTSFNTENVQNMEEMFENTTNLKEVVVGDKWVQKAECNINNMFEESQITNVSKKEE